MVQTQGNREARILDPETSPNPIQAAIDQIAAPFKALMEMAPKAQVPFGTREKHELDLVIDKLNRELHQEFRDAGLIEKKTIQDGSIKKEVWIPTEEGKERLATMKKEEQAEPMAELKERRACNLKIRELLEAIDEDTYPRQDPETPGRMFALLSTITSAYVPVDKQGKRRRSLEIILRYLRGSIGNTWFLWSEWINSAIVVGDYSVAEALMAAAWECHEYARYAKRYHGHLVACRGILYLIRDDDFDKALDYLELARDNYANDPACMGLYKQLSYAERHDAQAVACRTVEPRALVTRSWNHDGFEQRIEAREAERLITAGGADDTCSDDTGDVAADPRGEEHDVGVGARARA